MKYIHDILLNFKSKRLDMINKDRAFFQYKGRDLVYIIFPLTSQLWTASHKVAIKYVGPVVVYKIIDPHNYLLMILDGKILRGFIWTWETKTHGHKHESGKCSKFSAIKANYEHRFNILLESISQLSYQSMFHKI